MSAPLTDLADELEETYNQLYNLLEDRLEATLELRTVTTGYGFDQARQKELEPHLIVLETRIEQARLNLECLKLRLSLLEVGGVA